MKNILRFIVIFFSAITMATLFPALLSIKVKLGLGQEQYHLVQSVMRGSSIFFIIEIITLVLTVILLILERHTFRRFYCLLASSIFFAISLAIYLIFTWPVNKQTQQWAIFPDSWEALRSKWEYAQAARATLSLLGFTFIIVHLLIRKNKSSKGRYPKSINY